MPRLSGLAFGVACVAGAAAVAGQGASAPRPVVGSALILGQVVEAGTTDGVPGATVSLFGAPGGTQRVIADGQGRFLFRELPARAYSITSTASGYADGAYGRAGIVTTRRGADLGRRLELAEADRLVAVAIAMVKMSSISGRVLDEAGEPVVGARLSVLRRTAGWDRPMMDLASTVTTDDRGRYRADVVPGEYLVALFATAMTVPASILERYQEALRQGVQGLAEFRTETQGLDATLVGLVAGEPSVRAGNLNATSLSGPGIFVADGRLVFYPTIYHPSALAPSEAVAVTLAAGEEREGVDVRLRLEPARRVSGRVVGPSGPVPYVGLQLLVRDAGVSLNPEMQVPHTQLALADGAGEFTFLGVAPGSYTVQIVTAAEGGSDPVLWAADALTVGSDADTINLEIRLRPAARISGQVAIEGTAASLAPERLRGISITPQAAPDSVGIMARRPPVRPDEAHRFSTAALPPGDYLIAVAGIPPGWVLKSVTTGGRDVSDKPFELTSAGVADMVVTITNQISTLSGTARGANGEPASMATIVVFPVDKSMWPAGPASRRIQTVAPGRNGEYAFRGLPSGQYFILAANWSFIDFTDVRTMTTLSTSASRVTINDGETRTQDLQVVVRR